MIIPRDPAQLQSWAADTIQNCFRSYQDRANQYRIFRNLYLSGKADGQLAVYNRIQSHIDLLTSYMFSGETAAFEIEHDGKEERYDLMAYEWAKRLQHVFGDDLIDVMTYDAIIWALVYGSFFFKALPDGTFLLDPFDIGVWREDLTSLDDQECICHRYYITKDQARRILLQAVEVGKISTEAALDAYRRVRSVSFADDSEVISPTVQQLIITSTSPNIQGASLVPYQLRGSEIARPDVDVANIIKCYEIWAWDDMAEDYRIVSCFDPDVVFLDRPNYYLPHEHPFIQFAPNRVYNYFFGSSELWKLLRLQEWSEDRIDDLKKKLKKDVDPPIGMIGMSTIPKDFKDAFQPGGVVPFGFMPNTKAEQLNSQLGDDMWKSFEADQGWFTDISGMPGLLKGQGEKGVRSQQQLNKLSTLASARLKKAALLCEDSLERYASLKLKLMQRYDRTRMYYTLQNQNIPFIAAQFDASFAAKVASHSTSPVFKEDIRETTFALLDRKIIPADMAAEMLQFPYANRIRAHLKKVADAEQAKEAQERQLEEKKLASKGR